MAHNQTGIFIAIKAFLPTGKTLDEQFAALTIVKQAHESGDYSALLAAAQIDEVKTENKTRRVEDAPVVVAVDGANIHGIGPDTDGGPNPNYQPPQDNAHVEDGAEQFDEPTPEFAEVDEADEIPWGDAPTELEPDVPAPARRKRA